MKLDVGCGDLWKGDVNCDIWMKPKNPHLSPKRRMNPKNIKNFVCCDIHFLPFKTKGFTETLCSHVLEHKGVNVIKSLREMVRVTSGIITIYVPHRYYRDSKRLRYFQHKEHDKYFSNSSIEKILQKLGLTGKITAKKESLLSAFIPIIQVPTEIKVEIPVK